MTASLHELPTHSRKAHLARALQFVLDAKDQLMLAHAAHCPSRHADAEIIGKASELEHNIRGMLDASGKW